jgi:hypothetical protein
MEFLIRGGRGEVATLGVRTIMLRRGGHLKTTLL